MSRHDPAALPKPLVYKYDTACHVLGGISKSTLLKLIAEGKLKKANVGGRETVTVESVERVAAEAAA